MMKRQGTPDSRHTQAEFHRQLQAGNVSPLYLFEGEETLLRDQFLRELIDHEVDPTVRDFNFSTITVAGGDLGAAIETARQLPMMASRRVVAVTGFEAVTDERQLEGLGRYLAEPNPSSVVVFVSNALDNRRVISGLLRRACVLVSFQRFAEGQDASVWIADYIAQRGARIAATDAAYLVGMVGTDLRRLASEADKLTTLVGESGRITRKEIVELVRHSREHTNFEISDAIRDGDRARALRVLDHVFAEKVEAPLVLGAIAGTFRRMLIAKSMIAEGASSDEVAKAIGTTAYWARPINERVRKLDTRYLLRGLKRIAETDVALKSSIATPRLQLEVLICELCPTVIEVRKKSG